MNVQVSDSALALNQTVEESLVQLETAFQEQTDYVSIVQKLQGQLDELVRLMVDVPFWSNTDISLEDLARKTEAFDFYRSVLTSNGMCFVAQKYLLDQTDLLRGNQQSYGMMFLHYNTYSIVPWSW